MNQSFYDKLTSVIAKERVYVDEPMSRHTTFRVGGPADFFVTPKAKEEVRDVIRICKEAGMPYYIIGNGSNLLVSDAGYRGVVVQIYKEMNEVKVEGDLVKAQAEHCFQESRLKRWGQSFQVLNLLLEFRGQSEVPV